MNEDQLIEKLRRIEALFASSGHEGERLAAAEAKERMLRRLREAEATDPPIEYTFTMADDWSKQLFMALLRRYGLKPYRYRRQRYTTVMVRVPQGFVDQTLWPQYQELAKTLTEHLKAVTSRVISEVMQEDGGDAEIRAELPPGDTGR
jgi:hypothetical protein